jgi:hypothetical protein
MSKEQALTVIKQTIDNALKAGAIANIETAQVIAQAFQIIVSTLNEKDV